MDRYFEVAPAGIAPTAPAANPGYPTNGNPGAAVPASEPGEWWFHMMTEELRGVIAAAGITPNHADVSQLSTAIRRLIDGGDYKDSVRVASTAPIDLAAPGATIDGVVMVVGDSFLEKDHATASSRGIYVWNGAAVPATRRADADTGSELNSGALVPVEEGTANADTVWMLATDGAITIGTTALTWQIKSGDASTTRKGQVQLATAAEILSGADGFKAATAASLLAGLLGAGGVAGDDYLTIPFRDKSTGVRRNLIVQWGLSNVAASNANTDVTLPLAYPNAHLKAYISIVGVAAATQAGATPLSLTQVRLNQSYTGGAQQMSWLSIGY